MEKFTYFKLAFDTRLVLFGILIIIVVYFDGKIDGAFKQYMIDKK